MRSSIRFSFTGRQVGCTMKTSAPLMLSSYLTLISPSAKVFTSTRPSITPSLSAILAPSSGLPRPVKSMSDLSADRLTEVCGSQSATRSFLMVPSLSFIVLRTLMRAQPHRITRNVLPLRRRPDFDSVFQLSLWSQVGERTDLDTVTQHRPLRVRVQHEAILTDHSVH